MRAVQALQHRHAMGRATRAEQDIQWAPMAASPTDTTATQPGPLYRLESSRSRGRWLLSVVLVGLLGVVVRFAALDRQSFWLDEAYSMTVAQQPLTALLGGEVGDAHTPPLYYLLLHAWLLGGESDAWVRGLSALFSTCLLLGLPLALGALRVSPVLIALATALVAISPHNVYFAQEARMYSLASLLAVAVFTLEELASRGRRPGIDLSLALAAAAGLYCHYYFAFVIAGSVLYRAGRLLKGRAPGDSWTRLVATHAAAAALFAPWLPVIARLAAEGGQAFRTTLWPVPGYALARMLLGYAVVPTTAAMKADPALAALAAWPWLALAGAAALVATLGLWRRVGATGRPSPGVTAHAATVVVVTVAVPFAVSLVMPIYGERYVGIAQPLLLLLLAEGLLRWPRPVALAGATTLLALSLGATLLWSTGAAGTKEAWRDVAALLDAQGHAGDALVVDPWYCRPPLYRYLRRGDLERRVSSDAADRGKPIELCRDPATWPHPRVWVVQRTGGPRRIEDFRLSLGACAGPAVQIFFPEGVGIVVARFDSRSPPRTGPLDPRPGTVGDPGAEPAALAASPGG